MTRGTAKILNFGQFAAIGLVPIAVGQAIAAERFDSLIMIGIVFFVGMLGGHRYRTGYRCPNCQLLAALKQPGHSFFWNNVIPPKDCPNCDEPMPE